MVAENPETPKGTPNTLWNILDEKSKKNLELILQKQKNFNLLEYLKKTVENLTRKHVNFSINIQELSHLKNLSPETQKNIIALIKEKNKDNPHIRDIESNQTLKQFLSEVYASLGDQNEDTLSEDTKQKINFFNNIKLTNAEIFPTLFGGDIHNSIDSQDLNTILNFQLSKEIKESKEALEKATAPLAHAFDISYHLLKDKKYPLSDKEIQEHFSHNKKEYENIEKKIKEKDNTVQEENSKEHPDEKRIGQLLQEIETLKRNYKILQLPQGLQNSALTFFNKNLSQCENQGQKLLDFVAESTAHDLIEFPSFHICFEDENGGISTEKQNQFKLFCKNLLSPQSDSLSFGKDEQGNPQIMTLEKFLTNEKDNCPFSFKIKNVSKPLKTFIKTRINGNIGDSLSAQDLVSIYLARNSSDRIPERDFQNGDDPDEEYFQHHKEQEENQENIAKFEKNFEKKTTMKFEKGLKIWLPLETSELPPFKDETKSRIKAEVIENNNDSFKVKVNGGELKFKNFEDKEFTLPKSEETLDKRKDMKVTKGNSFEEVANQLNFGTKFKDIKWENGHYERGSNNANNEGEVKYFSFTDDLEGEKYPILYEVEYLKDKVRLKTDFLKDGQQYNYEKEMEYDQFLLFLQTKNLQPTGNTQAEILKKSKKDKKIEYQKSPIRKWNRFSINSIKEGVKGLWKKMKDAMDAKDKKNADDFNDWLYDPDGLNAYGILSKRGIFSSIKNWAKEEQMKQVIEGGKSRMGKINEYLKLMEEDGEYNSHVKSLPRYPNDVFTPPPLQALLGNTDPGKATIDTVVQLYDVSKTKKQLQTAAAVMLAQLSKGKSLYRHFPQLENEGAWVKILLGEEARQKYLEDRAKLQAQINQGGGDKKQLWDLMAKAEVSFICNTIRGDEREFFSGIKGYKGLPEDFADKLESSYKEKHSASEADTEFGNSKHTSFPTAKADFEKKLQDGRFSDAIGQLRKILTLAITPQQHKAAQAAFTALLLSGKIEYFCGKKEKDQIIKMARAYSFPPGLVIENPNFQAIILALIDKIAPSQKLKNAVKERNRKDIITFCNLRFVEHGQEFEKFCKNDLILKNWNNNPSLKELKEKLLDDSDSSTDDDVMGNRNAKIHRGLNSNIGVIEELQGYKDGKFNKEPDATIFREGLIKDVQNFPQTPAGMEYLLLQRFNKFFLNSSGDIEEMERVLLFLAENSDEKLQQIYQRDKKSIIKEYLQALTLNNYSDPPDLFKQVINTFAEKFVNNITSIQQIILKKTPDRKAIKPKNFETALKRYAQNKKRINWDFKTEGIGAVLASHDKKDDDDNTFSRL